MFSKGQSKFAKHALPDHIQNEEEAENIWLSTFSSNNDTVARISGNVYVKQLSSGRESHPLMNKASRML